MFAFVYVAHEPSKGRIKIGYSENLPGRLYAVRGWLKFDFLTSRCLRLSSVGAARRLESELKVAFSSWKVCCDPSEQFAEGSGELYDDECIYGVLSFLAAKRDSFYEGRSLEAIPIEWRCPPDEGPRACAYYRPRGMLTPWELRRRGY
ncbi:GIY-YIG nuclease family protein [Variovorax sp. ZT4R33]|uniref:GIY-YIG nuclease family protein n=1 Tax=Variovorax sp. ZT4R33 TaxID=3443743 RepID=UPI003F47C30F